VGKDADLIFEVITTPGHRPDHCSYGLFNYKTKEKILFPGDIILGTPSVKTIINFNSHDRSL
jgi:glyoxylase-like metal-dependent hydrolase (beta-lactamase superfamily II)